jgi:hypothetical protein
MYISIMKSFQRFNGFFLYAQLFDQIFGSLKTVWMNKVVNRKDDKSLFLSFYEENCREKATGYNSLEVSLKAYLLALKHMK